MAFVGCKVLFTGAAALSARSQTKLCGRDGGRNEKQGPKGCQRQWIGRSLMDNLDTRIVECKRITTVSTLL